MKKDKKDLKVIGMPTNQAIDYLNYQGPIFQHITFKVDDDDSLPDISIP